MSNEVLIAIVAINAIMTLSLWRMMATKASRPAGLNKKAAKALWHSDPIVPRHDPPKVLVVDEPPRRAPDSWRECLAACSQEGLPDPGLNSSCNRWRAFVVLSGSAGSK